MYSIKVIAERTGKTTRALRYYEELGILRPLQRTAAGYRMYGEQAIVQIEWIDKLHRLGFSLPDIKEFLSSFQQIESAPDLMAALGNLYQEKLVEIRDRISQLQALEEELQASVDYTQQCSPCQPGTEVSHCGKCAMRKSVTVPTLVAVLQESIVQESIQDQIG